MLARLIDWSLRNVFLGLSREFSKIKAEQLTDEFAKIVAGSPEDSMRASDGSGLSAGARSGVRQGGAHVQWTSNGRDDRRFQCL